MATTERDLYELLGVSRSASDADIKRAFRKLARELHPDVSDAPDADERFKEIAAAYEVLSNPDSRERYDRFGMAGVRQGRDAGSMFADFGSLSDIFSAFFGESAFGAQQTRGPLRGADVTLAAEIAFDDAFRGTRLRLPSRIAVVCDRCTGNGAEPGTQPERCPVCGGIGRVRELTQSVFGQIVREGVCGTCQGSGQLVESPCVQCDGSGRLLDERELEVDVPAGIHDGQRIRLRGEGHAGALGGPRGDAFVIVRVAADPRFVRDGDDLHTTVQVSMIQAAIGSSVLVASPEGDIELTIDPGTQPRDVRVLRGKGMPSLTSGRRGDLHVLVDVRVPRSLTSEQSALLEQLDASIGEDAYRDDDGFFDRLKNAFR